MDPSCERPPSQSARSTSRPSRSAENPMFRQTRLRKKQKSSKLRNNTHTIHVWYIYLHEWLIFMVNVAKYTSPMDNMGNIYWHVLLIYSELIVIYIDCILILISAVGADVYVIYHISSICYCQFFSFNDHRRVHFRTTMKVLWNVHPYATLFPGSIIVQNHVCVWPCMIRMQSFDVNM